MTLRDGVAISRDQRFGDGSNKGRRVFAKPPVVRDSGFCRAGILEKNTSSPRNEVAVSAGRHLMAKS